MARFHRTLLTTLGTAGAFTSRANAIEVVDFLIFDPGPSCEHHHFADEPLKEATQDLLASANDTGCNTDLTVPSADALTNVKTEPRKDSLDWGAGGPRDAFFHYRCIKSELCS
jgi:hypothetical protein